MKIFLDDCISFAKMMTIIKCWKMQKKLMNC